MRKSTSSSFINLLLLEKTWPKEREGGREGEERERWFISEKIYQYIEFLANLAWTQYLKSNTFCIKLPCYWLEWFFLNIHLYWTFWLLHNLLDVYKWYNLSGCIVASLASQRTSTEILSCSCSGPMFYLLDHHILWIVSQRHAPSHFLLCLCFAYFFPTDH